MQISLMSLKSLMFVCKTKSQQLGEFPISLLITTLHMSLTNRLEFEHNCAY